MNGDHDGLPVFRVELWGLQEPAYGCGNTVQPYERAPATQGSFKHSAHTACGISDH